MEVLRARGSVADRLGRVMSAAACLLAVQGLASAAIDRTASGSTNHAIAPVECESWRADRNAALEADPKLPFAPSSLLVMFEKGADEDTVLKAIGGEVLARLNLVPGLTYVSTSLPIDQAIDVAMKIGGGSVRYAEPDHVTRISVAPNDPEYGRLWGLRNTGQTVNGDPGVAGFDIRAEQAWDVITIPSSITIASIDTGVRRTHRDLARGIWRNAGEIAGNGIDDDRNGLVDDTWGWDFFNNDNDPTDDHGHGTHTAGTFGARGNDGVGIAGVAWNCSIMPLKFMGRSGGFTSDAIRALDYAVRMRAAISNNSWGSYGNSQSLADAIRNAGVAGHLFIAAAGNEGFNADAIPMYPAAYPLDNIISVAAINNDGGLASFSNFGRDSVDIAAPGVQIYSCSAAGDQSYTFMSGTSMAAPHVAGAAALIWSDNPLFSLAQVRARLLLSARQLPSLAGMVATGGMLDAAAALRPVTMTTSIRRGIADNFSRSNGTEAAGPRSSLAAAARSHFALPLIPFDVFPGGGANPNVIFADSFTSLPTGIRSATLSLRVHAGVGGSETDTIRLGFATSSAASQIPAFSSVSIGTAAGRTWSQGQTATVSFNLASFRPSSGPSVNLLPQLNSRRFLDVLVSDDSGVDFMELNLVSEF